MPASFTNTSQKNVAAFGWLGKCSANLSATTMLKDDLPEYIGPAYIEYFDIVGFSVPNNLNIHYAK